MSWIRPEADASTAAAPVSGRSSLSVAGTLASRHAQLLSALLHLLMSLPRKAAKMGLLVRLLGRNRDSGPKGRVAIALSAAAFVVSAAPALAEDPCPNAALRTGIEKQLPDCRAYEVADQFDKGDSPTLFESWGFPDGDHLYWSHFSSLPGSGSGQYSMFLSTRTASGWTSRTLGLPQKGGEPSTLFSPGTGDSIIAAAFSNDAQYAYTSTAFTGDSRDQNNGDIDIYRYRMADGSAEVVGLPEVGDLIPGLYEPDDGTHTGPPGSYIGGVSEDGSRLYFVTRSHFSTAAGTPPDTHDTASNQLYLRTGGHTYVAGILPDGTQPCGVELGFGVRSTLNNYPMFTWGSVAPDGSNVVFRTPGGGCPNATKEVFLRDMTDPAAGSTIQLPGTTFAGRSADGKVVFTMDAHSAYAYNTTNGQSRTLYTDPDTGGNASDNVRMLAWSRDGSRVYLADPSGAGRGMYLVDSSGPHLIPGTEAGGVTEIRPVNGFAVFAHVGIHEGEITGNTAPEVAQGPVASADGTKVMFRSLDNLTSYDANGLPMVYLYDSDTNTVVCISCPPGAPSDAPTNSSFGILPNNPLIPGRLPALSNDGKRAVFQTRDALVPRDINGLSDVYEWDHGTVSLLSSGGGSSHSVLVGVSTDMRDIFIRTSERLVPELPDNGKHVYDARVGGGFDYSEPTYGCDAGDCQAASSPAPGWDTPASSGFTGPGNATSAAARPRLSLTRTARASRNRKSFMLVLRVPVEGLVSLAGKGAKRASRNYDSAGLKRLTVRLTTKSRRSLKRRKAISLRLKVRYTPVTGDPSVQTIRVRVAR